MTNGLDLRRFSVFQDLTQREADRLGRALTARAYRRREMIYVPEELSDPVFLVAEGLVKVSRLSVDGRETTLLLLDPGELFGDLAPPTAGPRETVAEALMPSLVCTLPRGALTEAMARNARLGLRVSEMLARRLREVEWKVEAMAHKPVPARLARLLLDLAGTYGHKDGQGIRLNVALAHQDLANQIGSTRETTTATLNAFKRRGLIATARCQIVIVDLPRLTACA